MTYIKKNFLITFLFIYFLVGAFYSLNTGLSFDAYVEQRTWEYNIKLVKHIFLAAELYPMHGTYPFDANPMKYYGIGFQIISQPIQFILGGIILKFQDIDSFGAYLLAKHFVVFTAFFISGIFVYLIISKIIDNKFFCKTATFLYLAYPYLLGHGLFSPKDIPFLCFWIICTYVSINIFYNLTKDGHLKYSDVILISFLSAFLLSVRVAGVLIFIQYLFTLIIFLHSEKLQFKHFLQSHYKKILSFILLTTRFTYLFYPVFWRNPLLFFDAV